MGTSSPVPAVEAQPQVKLGRVPKNARLIEAMAQHKNAKPKPKGWLMAVVDSIYKEGAFLHTQQPACWHDAYSLLHAEADWVLLACRHCDYTPVSLPSAGGSALLCFQQLGHHDVQTCQLLDPSKICCPARNQVKPCCASLGVLT
jgi:hypothetical protein